MRTAEAHTSRSEMDMHAEVVRSFMRPIDWLHLCRWRRAHWRDVHLGTVNLLGCELVSKVSGHLYVALSALEHDD